MSAIREKKEHTWNGLENHRMRYVSIFLVITFGSNDMQFFSIDTSIPNQFHVSVNPQNHRYIKIYQVQNAIFYLFVFFSLENSKCTSIHVQWIAMIESRILFEVHCWFFRFYMFFPVFSLLTIVEFYLFGKEYVNVLGTVADFNQIHRMDSSFLLLSLEVVSYAYDKNI